MSPCERHAARLRNHVHLGDAAFHEAIRELIAKRDETGVEHQVGVERDDAVDPSAAHASSASV